MYSSYNMANFVPNMHRNRPILYGNQKRNQFHDRIYPGSFIAPFLLGGIAGYAIGRPNFYPYNYYYNNFYYPPYYFYY